MFNRILAGVHLSEFVTEVRGARAFLVLTGFLIIKGLIISLLYVHGILFFIIVVIVFVANWLFIFQYNKLPESCTTFSDLGSKYLFPLFDFTIEESLPVICIFLPVAYNMRTRFSAYLLSTHAKLGLARITEGLEARSGVIIAQSS